jgi:hypothetical protein
MALEYQGSDDINGVATIWIQQTIVQARPLQRCSGGLIFNCMSEIKEDSLVEEMIRFTSINPTL